MAVVPSKALDRVQFYENHATPFSTNAVAIGISAAEATDLQTKTDAARAAYDLQKTSQDTAKAATEAFQNAVAAMTLAGAAIIKKIKAKALVAGPDVYTLAQIPSPATPTPVGPPGLPYKLVATLKPNGSLEMTFKCDNPSGCTNVIYQIFRKVEATDEYSFLGGTGSRVFVDTSLPMGVPSVMYQIQGTRSTAVGDAAEFVVKFGTTSSGGVTTSVIEGNPSKVAV